MEVRLDKITKKFGSVKAVDNFSLTIKSGEFLVLVGPSGCGKTTLLRLIAGFEETDSGSIYLGDVLANDVEVDKRNVQMIFQNYALWPHMKVMDESTYTNLSFALKIRNWSVDKISPYLKGITKKVGLDSKLFSRKPGQLSAGEKQRVALARAMTTSPQVFLMDEPFANLDPPSRVKLRQEIKQWHHEIGATVIYVTHIMTDACALADRIALMRDGQLVQVGTEKEIREHPVDQFVKYFLLS